MRYCAAFVVLVISALIVSSTPPANAVSAGQLAWVPGTWNTTIQAGNQMAHLTLVLTQKAASVSGTYGVGGSIECLMHINFCKGKYKDSSGNGWVEFQFSQDGKSFVGNYGSTPGIIAGSWKGKKGHAGSTHETHVPTASPAPSPT
jgi:hypothetical protein